MTKRISLFLTAMMLVISAAMYGQKLQKSNLGMQLPKYASKNVMTSSVQLQDNECWTGYWDGVIDESIRFTGADYMTPMDYGVAILYPADDPLIKGKTIEGIKFGFPSITNIANVKVFITTDISDPNAEPNICVDEVTDLTSFEVANDPMNEVRFSKPYTVGSKPVYIGYSFTVTGGESEYDKFPIPIKIGKDMANALFIKTTYTEWLDYSESFFGVAAIQVLVSGESVAQKVEPEISFDIADATCVIGEGFTAPVLNNPNNLSVVYSSSNEDVAVVDATTGSVTALAEGVTTITAKSAETDVYLAGEASYLLTVTTSGDVPSTPEILYQETFAESLGDFVVEGNNGFNNNIWKWEDYATADAYNKYEGGALENYLVSPVITLKGQNVVSFDHYKQYIDDPANTLFFAIRLENGEWINLDIANYPETGGFVNTGDIVIPTEYDNQNVQFGFKYTATDPNAAGVWQIKNFVVVSKGSGDVPSEKMDPEISFSVGDVEAILGQDFLAPTLNNPNFVEVVYTSYKPEVATVDPYTGEVTLVAEGFTTITATSIENNQFKSASVNYVLTVKPAGDVNIIFSESFTKGLGDFVTEGEGAENVWSYYYSAAKADGYNYVSGESISYLVSPVINLKENNVMSFEYESMYFTIERIDKDMRMAIRLVGGEWTYLEIPNRQTATEVAVNSGDIIIPAEFNNKEVQIAFAYACDGSFSSGMWYVRNFVVKGEGGSSEGDKKDPELAFEQDTYEFVFDSSKFDGAKLINPYNVEVTYEIKNNDYSVADVEPYTGVVWVYDYGTVVITAKFEGNDEFNAAEVSYTLNVVDVPTGIEGITADDLKNGKVYTLDGVRVNKLGKGVYIVNGKKVVIK